jgi:universal stress protein A
MKTSRLKNSRGSAVKRGTIRIAPKSSPTTGPNGSIAASVKFKRILVPTDFSTPSLKALRYAVRFAEHSGATIFLVYVLEQPAFINDPESFRVATPEAELARLAKEKLLSVASSEIEELVPVKAEVRIGKPFREIVSLARQTDTDLIVIATRGRTGVNRMLLGSTTELVVRHAPCPVLVVREHEHEFV